MGPCHVTSSIYGCSPSGNSSCGFLVLSHRPVLAQNDSFSFFLKIFFFFFQFCGSGRSPILDKQLTKALTDISKLMLCLQGCVCTAQEYPVTAESGLGTWIPWNWLQTAVSNLSVGAAT